MTGHIIKILYIDTVFSILNQSILSLSFTHILYKMSAYSLILMKVVGLYTTSIKWYEIPSYNLLIKCLFEYRSRIPIQFIFHSEPPKDLPEALIFGVKKYIANQPQIMLIACWIENNISTYSKCKWNSSPIRKHKLLRRQVLETEKHLY